MERSCFCWTSVAHECEQMRLDLAEHLIPLGKLGERLSDLPQDKSADIVVDC
jgi:hypothetical protein